MSQEARKFLKILEDGTKMKDGYYQIPLLLRDALNCGCIDTLTPSPVISWDM